MKNISLKYGLFLFTALTLFFFSMHVLNLSENFNLRLFNGALHLLFIYIAIAEYRRKNLEGEFHYVAGVTVGMGVSVVGVLGFAFLQLIYLTFDTEFMQYLKANAPVGEYLTPFTAALIIFMEGIAFSLIASYILTRIIEVQTSE